MTRDIDLVDALAAHEFDVIVGLFDPEYYVKLLASKQTKG